MRVPTYNRQTQQTAKTGAINFSVRANPGALSAGLRGLATLGNAITGEALKYYETETKERRLNELTKAENAYKIQIQNLKLASLNEDPNTVINGNPSQGKFSFERQALDNMNTIANMIDDKKVRSSFIKSAEQIMIGERASVFQSARNRRIDIAVADELQAAELLIKDAVQGNGHQRAVAMIELFGGVNVPTGPDDDDTGAPVIGIFDQMADRGLITREKAFNLKKNTQQRIAKSDFRTRLASADRSGNPAEAAQLVADVMDPKNFSDMKPEDRDTAFTQAVNLEQQLQKRAVQLAEKAETKASKDQKNRHSDNARKIIARIITADENPNNQQAQDNRPTSLEIANLLTTDGISDAFARTANDLINDVDADVRDPDLIAGIFSDISVAKTDEELDAAVARITPAMGKDGTIPLQDALALLRFADGKKNKTLDTKDIDFYRQQLDDITGATAYRISGMGVGEDEVFRQADAADTYRRLTTDPANPMPAREAYQMVIEQFFRARKQRIDFLAPAPFLDIYFGGKKPSEWTAQDVSGARIAITTNRNLTELEKTLEFETLDQITKLIESRPPVSPPGDPQDGDGTWRDWLRNWWRNRNSLSDRENDIRNPG